MCRGVRRLEVVHVHSSEDPRILISDPIDKHSACEYDKAQCYTPWAASEALHPIHIVALKQ